MADMENGSAHRVPTNSLPSEDMVGHSIRRLRSLSRRPCRMRPAAHVGVKRRFRHGRVVLSRDCCSHPFGADGVPARSGGFLAQELCKRGELAVGAGARCVGRCGSVWRLGGHWCGAGGGHCAVVAAIVGRLCTTHFNHAHEKLCIRHVYE